jgi:asparagine synthase (glutamine-hydrolysing)
VGDLLPHLIYQMDEPIAQHSVIQTMYVSALARHTGIPVLLSGDAGDELFLGYNHYQADQALGRFLALPRLLRQRVLIPFMERFSRWRELARKARQDEPAARYLEWMRVFTQAEAQSLLCDSKQSALAPDIMRQMLLPFLTAPHTSDFADRIAYTSLRLWIPEDSNMRVDKMSMLMSIEARAPLEDHRLVDLALRLPSRYKLRGGTFKAVFKDAMKDFIPQRILDRPKWGFIPPTSDWLRTVFLPLVETYLSPDYVRAAGLVEPELVSRWVTEHMAKTGYHLKPLWSLLTLHLWHAMYIDGSLSVPARLTPADVVAQAQIVEGT